MYEKKLHIVCQSLNGWMSKRNKKSHVCGDIIIIEWNWAEKNPIWDRKWREREKWSKIDYKHEQREWQQLLLISIENRCFNYCNMDVCCFRHSFLRPFQNTWCNVISEKRAEKNWLILSFLAAVIYCQLQFPFSFLFLIFFFLIISMGLELCDFFK